MPTNAKRVQVLLPPKVLKLVEGISEEEGESLSRTCSILIREALHNRGHAMGPLQTEAIKQDYISHREADKAKPEPIRRAEPATLPDEEALALLQKFKALRDAGLL